MIGHYTIQTELSTFNVFRWSSSDLRSVSEPDLQLEGWASTGWVSATFVCKLLLWVCGEWALSVLWKHLLVRSMRIRTLQHCENCRNSPRRSNSLSMTSYLRMTSFRTSRFVRMRERIKFAHARSCPSVFSLYLIRLLDQSLKSTNRTLIRKR